MPDRRGDLTSTGRPRSHLMERMLYLGATASPRPRRATAPFRLATPSRSRRVANLQVAPPA